MKTTKQNDMMMYEKIKKDHSIQASSKGVFKGIKWTIVISCFLFSMHTALSQSNTFPPSGNAGIETTTPETKLHVQGGTDASLQNHGYLVLGGTSILNLVMDDNEIMARNNGLASSLFLQAEGGDLEIHSLGSESEKFIVKENGWVGIGTSTPAYQLDVAGNLNITGTLYQNGTPISSLATPWVTNGSDVYYNNGDVGIGTNNPQQKLDVRGRVRSSNNESNEFIEIDHGGSNAYVNWDGDGSLDFRYSQNNLLSIKQDGKVGIGNTTIPSGYKLAVDGKIIAEELKVQLSENWPDYVFEKEYDLLSIEELESSIKANKHLPNIPSAKEVAEEGIAVGKMQAKLLEKIEELTLYLISQEKKISTLEEKLNALNTSK